jgi:3' terminal RNA ribose 2'-O-methyltransferase Hen1
MLLTIATTYQPATDLGYLLHKHPARSQAFDLTCGQAHVFYPEATERRCTCALLLDVDPVALVRGRGAAARPLGQYVNDRPYVASSLLSVAINKAFHTAMAGRCEDRPELVETALPLEARLAALPCRGGQEVLARLFAPLGYEVEACSHPLDSAFPDWGESICLSVTLRTQARLQDLLAHLYVLIPVLDNDKHYWVGDEEVEKLLARGAAWLPAHPERELISARYLRHRRRLVNEALARLAEEDDTEDEDEEEKAPEPRLREQRIAAVMAALRECGAQRVLDLGCGEGALLRALLADPSFAEIVGLDVSWRVLQIAKERLHYDRLPPRRQARLKLVQGSLIYRDQSLSGYDAAVAMEVIEHLDAARLGAFARVLFEFARPQSVIITTPNAEYNARYGMAAGRLRHRDHRFEWSRAEFSHWAEEVAARHGYAVSSRPVGDEDPALGAPTQMAVFRQEAK